MEEGRTNRLRLRAIHLLLFLSLAALAHSTYGHFYRYPVKEQLKTWHDGVPSYDYVVHPTDSFDPVLYEDLRSVDDSAQYILSLGEYANEEELLRATYDVMRARFLHYMYPSHTWLTNPVLAMLGHAFPDRLYNTMALADANLRHSVGVPFGGAATTFIKVYRAVGGQAQFVAYDGPPGHQLAEAIADGKKYLVDADLEVLAPMSVRRFAANPSHIPQYYAHRSFEERDVYREIYAQRPWYGGFDGPPTSSRGGYAMQAALEKAKFAVPAVIWRCSV